MRPPQRRYSRDQIVHAGRWAWASSHGDDEPDLYFDGVGFWIGPKGGERRPVAAETTPMQGWWHARDCRCELCCPSPPSPRQTS
jgi:hypothetical protein